MSVLHTPRKRYGWPFARQRLIDRATVVAMQVNLPQPMPSLGALKLLFAPGSVHTVLLGQTVPVTIIDSATDADLADWLDVVLLNAANVLSLPSVSHLTVALSSLHHDPDTGRSFRFIALTP
jgi:hypothetical protein